MLLDSFQTRQRSIKHIIFLFQLFGYFQAAGDEEEITVGEEVSVFMVSKRRRVGEAAGRTFRFSHYYPCVVVNGLVMLIE